ncbi:MAG: sulfatase [Candidatus Hydrogenedentes bacterium]|nr:sulfatase [Candidatus Hydrogenedentota bacterium]
MDRAGHSRVSRRRFLWAAAAAPIALAGCAHTHPEAPEQSGKRPNLLFVFPDEFRRQAIGCTGADPVITPNLDRFATESLLLTNTYSNRPVCSPFRASMLTGRYPFSNGVVTNCYSGSAPYHIQLRESERCISDVLHDRGYHCGYIGKWHLESPHEPYVDPRGPKNAWDEYTPLGPRRHGFEFWHSYGCYDDHLHPHYWIGDAPRDKAAHFDEWSPRHETTTAIEFLRNTDGKQRPADKPFALFMSMNPPHMPFDAVPPEYVERYGAKTCEKLLTRPNVDFTTKEGQIAKRSAKNYFGAVTGIDEQFGRILQCLKEQGLENDTIVVFTSDHGEMMGSHGRMYKSVWFEEAFGIPFIIRWPGKIRPRRDDLLLSVPDFMPTLLSLMGLERDIPKAVEGTDYSAAFRGEHTRRPTSALFIRSAPELPDAEVRGIRTMRYTYVIERPGNTESRSLYDNEQDPYQLKNIAGAQPALEKELERELHTWLDRTRDPWRR